MKEIKLKFLYLYLFALFMMMQPILSVSKCNVPVIRKFTLSGMKYSVYDKMRICGHVHDKCCSVADEIKITKLWQQRTRPIIFQNLDQAVFYMRKLTIQFDIFARLDPRSLQLKYVVQRKVPYIKQQCSFERKTGTVLTSLRSVAIYRQSLRNSMRRLVDKVYGNNPQGRKLKLLYSDNNPFELESEQQMNKVQINKSKSRTIMQQRKLFGNNKLHQILRSLKYIKNEPIEYNSAVCSKSSSSFYKDFIVINEAKSKRCMSLVKKQFAFDNVKFRNYIGKAKAGLTKLAYYKANFYCSLCDAHQQKFFDLTQKKFIFSQQFCKNMLIKNEAVIKFINVIMIEYIDFLFRIVKCFDSPGNAPNNDSTNFLQKYKRRIPMISQCYQSLANGDEFMKSCWFICQSYKPLKISEFFDGDVALLKQAYLAIFSVLRKMKEAAHQQKEANENGENEFDDSNVDGMLVEPPSAHLTVSNKYYFDKKTRKQFLGTDTVATKLDMVQIQKLKGLFRRYRIRGFNSFIRNYQRQFTARSKINKKGKYYKAYMKQIKRKYATAVQKIKDNLKEHHHMNKKVLIQFQRIFKRQYLNQGTSSKVTPEFRPLRKLNHRKQDRILTESSNEVVRQAQILQQKLKNLKLKKDQLKNHQRTLREVSEAQIQQQQQHPGQPNKKEVKTGKKEEAIKRVPVEPGSQVYQANLSLFDVAKFQLDYQEDGIDLSKFINLIEFDEQVDDIISQKFKKNPQINLDVIESYLALRPKVINEFNHIYKDFIMGPEEMTAFTEHFTKAKEDKVKAYLEGNMAKINRAKAKVKKIQQKAHLEIMNQFEKEEAKAMKAKLKDLKREKMMNHKEIINNHVDEKHFDKNFHGIKDLFVKLFGS